MSQKPSEAPAESLAMKKARLRVEGVFSWLQFFALISIALTGIVCFCQEMYKVFNMGHRMEIYTDSETAKDIIEISKSFNVDAKVIGYCEAYDGKKVTVKSDKGTFTYLG